MQPSPLAGIDLNLLVALDALLVDANVGLAARRVGLSASAMSHALGRLRTLLDDPIVVRAGQKMVPTPRALGLAKPLREGLTLLSQAVAPPAPFDPAKETREVRIAAIDFAQNQLLPRLLATLRVQAPEVDVAFGPFEPRALKDLAMGDVDLVFALHRSISGLHSKLIAEEPFESVVRRGHPALTGRLTPAAFAALPHVLISSPGRPGGAVDKALDALGLTRRVALVVPTFTAAAIAVSESDMVLTGAAREARRMCAMMPLDRFKPPVTLAPFALGMFWHERTTSDPFLTWLRERVTEAAIEPSPRPKARSTNPTTRP